MKNLPAVPFSVFIADGSAAVRQALRWALEGLSDLEVVGEAADGVETVRRVREVSPDILLLEIGLAEQDGCAVARALKSDASCPLIVFLTIHSDTVSQCRCFEAGADGFLPKTSEWSTLVALIRRLLAERESTTGSILSHDETK
jgi:two-component system, NarL family, response regulator DegU